MNGELTFEQRVQRRKQLQFEFEQSQLYTGVNNSVEPTEEAGELKRTIAGLALSNRNTEAIEDQAYTLEARLFDVQGREHMLDQQNSRMASELALTKEMHEERLSEVQRELHEEAIREQLEVLRENAKPCAACTVSKAAINRLVSQHQTEITQLKEDYELRERNLRKQHQAELESTAEIFKQQEQRLMSSVAPKDAIKELSSAKEALKQLEIRYEVLEAENSNLDKQVNEMCQDTEQAVILKKEQEVLMKELETSTEINQSNIQKISQMQQLFHVYDAEIIELRAKLAAPYVPESIAEWQDDGESFPQQSGKWWRSKSRGRK